MSSVEEIHSVGTITNVETSYFTQLKHLDHVLIVYSGIKHVTWKSRTFRGVMYQQMFGAAMGSPVSPLLANLFMEWLEKQAIATTPVVNVNVDHQFI